MNDEQILTALEELAYDIWKVCDHFFYADEYVFQNLTLDDKSDKISDFMFALNDAIDKNFPKYPHPHLGPYQYPPYPKS